MKKLTYREKLIQQNFVNFIRGKKINTIGILILLVSCGTRTAETKFTGIKTDSISINNKRTLLDSVRFNDILFVKARDTSKSLIIGGIEYINASITFDKSITHVNKEIIDSKVIRVTKDIAKKEKITQKKDNSNLWIGIAFVVCLFVFLWFKTGSIRV
jgi:hypothetical protein